MTTIAAKFDLIEYTKQLCSVGVSQEQANVQAQAIEKAIEAAVAITKEEVKSDEFATKRDLNNLELVLKKDLELLDQKFKLEMASLRTDLIKWILGVGISASIISITAMAALLKIMLPA